MNDDYLHYQDRNHEALDAPSTYFLVPGISREHVMADARRRVELGHEVTIHHHHAGTACRDECERLGAN